MCLLPTTCPTESLFYTHCQQSFLSPKIFQKRYDLTLVCMKFNFLSQSNPSCNWDRWCWYIGCDDHSYTKTRLEWHACEITAAAQLSNQITSTGHVIPCGATVYVCAVECQEIRRQSRWALFDKLLIIHNLYHFLGYYKSRFVVLHLSTCRLRAAARLVTAAILSGGCHQPREKDYGERAIHLWATQQRSWWVPGVDLCFEGTRVWLHWPALRLV